MFPCYSEFNETPIFFLEQVDFSSCLFLLEKNLKKKTHLLNGKNISLCLCLRQNSVCTPVCVCKVPLAKVEMMTESQRKVSLALKFKVPAGLLHVFS